MIKFFVGLKDGFAKWAQTLVFYIALVGVNLGVARFDLPLLSDILVALSTVLLLSLFTVVRTRVSVSEDDFRNLQEKSRELKEELGIEKSKVEKLKNDLTNQKSQFLDMNWIWEINLAQVKIERIKLFDYFIRGNEDPILWKDRPERLLEKDKRAIGALKIDYTAKIGINLKDVLVHYDHENDVIQYWIPEPYQTGAVDPSDNWAIRTSMEYAGGEGLLDMSLDWRWLDEEKKHTALPIWEKEKTERYQEAFASQALKNELGISISGEAERRLKAFFEQLLGCKAIGVSREQLSAPEKLGLFLPNLMAKSEMNDTGTPAKQSI